MTSPDDRPGLQAGITRVSVQGYKSLRARYDIEIRPLTVLAGVNSSGKSSLMQPLLLLKQTLETPYDPGPLQLSGPNVDVTEIEQVLSRPISKNGRTSWFRVGVTLSERETLWRFGKDRHNNLRIMEMTSWFEFGQTAPVQLREGMEGDQLNSFFPYLLELARGLEPRHTNANLAVGRERCFLFPVIEVNGSGKGKGTIAIGGPHHEVEQALTGAIHLPALRGNPERTYPTAAVEDRFPGRFENYTAGVISAWQNRKRTDLLRQLRADLEDLGLTWKVEARRLDDTRVELVVGRLPHGRRGGAHDLVNIADVGFGAGR